MTTQTVNLTPEPAFGLERTVVVATSPVAAYTALPEPVPAPELPSGVADTVAKLAARKLLATWGLDRLRFGSKDWNPLGEFIRPGNRVTLKPNWVIHENPAGGLDCLITHPSVIEAILEYVALAQPGKVVLGDAPIQRCDFGALRNACNLDQLVDMFQQRGLPLTLCDFRRTIAEGVLGMPKRENLRGEENYVLFDLGPGSLLEPISDEAWRFRVTMYDPESLKRTHAVGRHQYLVAREVIEADVVINLPKLKCHRKACITGAVKNMVGMNGSKDYLPHHRFGGSEQGGDCYSGASRLKHQAEILLDAANGMNHGRFQHCLGKAAEIVSRAAVWLGEDDNLDGAWHGNDTVWRMTLDLQKILTYGRANSTLAGDAQRRVLHITDAIIGGEGEGPLYPEPVGSGYLTGALNAAAADWVHARLMGIDPRQVPIVREAFANVSYPLAHFEPRTIVVRLDGVDTPEDRIKPLHGSPFRPPKGWRNRCEAQIEQAVP